MYHSLALKITDAFVRKNVIEEHKKGIYIYGFEMIISTIVYGMIFLIILIVSNSFWQSMSFWLGLFVVRKTAGGHHAKSYKSCHLLFAINHIAFVALLTLLPSYCYIFIVYPILVVSLLSIFFFAPVDHKNKPFIKNEYKRFRLISRLYCAVLLVIILILAVRLIAINQYIFSFSIGTLSATISLLCAKIIRIKERNQKQ